MKPYLANDVAQEWDGGDMKLTLFSLNVKLVLMELGQDLFDVIFLRGWVDQYIINLSYHESAKKVPEHIIDETLEYWWSAG